jgi:hypothetical protein
VFTLVPRFAPTAAVIFRASLADPLTPLVVEYDVSFTLYCDPLLVENVSRWAPLTVAVTFPAKAALAVMALFIASRALASVIAAVRATDRVWSPVTASPFS